LPGAAPGVTDADDKPNDIPFSSKELAFAGKPDRTSSVDVTNLTYAHNDIRITDRNAPLNGSNRAIRWFLLVIGFDPDIRLRPRPTARDTG
jgi:hypothetical protein